MDFLKYTDDDVTDETNKKPDEMGFLAKRQHKLE
jgi:hypothetical protein